ncbi:hypothetical protein B7982_05355 [Fibrobacter sp. UWB2]|jgi:hypothetical protein|uniref:hypothetical protein n=1 Tax=Fibrobacter sp. UWB2 TaxID=1964358 RepID=UPI000B522A33|nr:hypothetical protein [Fibrobacter sp. UWB2]OWV23858.1 hypothetical protein B7982_05355 [Fibrobacter sp. UWB2]
MPRKANLYTDNIARAHDAVETWKLLGDVSEMLDEVYDERLFETSYDTTFPDQAAVKAFNAKCAELIQAYNQMNRLKIENEIKQHEAEIARLKSLIEK